MPLKLACGDYDRTLALRSGFVCPEGIDLSYVSLGMPACGSKMEDEVAFDAAEMSLARYSRLVATGDRRFTAIPVFLSRMFRHSCIYVASGSRFAMASDLAGRRVACPHFDTTTTVWLRGTLADYDGLPLDAPHFVTKASSGADFQIVGRCTTGVEPVDSGSTLEEMLVAGQVDALISPHRPRSFTVHNSPVRRLFDDSMAKERAYFRSTGIFPIMHVVVVRSVLLQRFPWIAQALLAAFQQAKEVAYVALSRTQSAQLTLPWLANAYEETVKFLGDEDYWSYGLESNRDTLETFLRYAHEQGVTPTRLAPEALFAVEGVP